MAYERQDKCSNCGISIPEAHEDADPSAMLCDTCYEKDEHEEPTEDVQ